MRRAAWLVGAAGAVLAVLGVLLFRRANLGSSGARRWAAYEPLGDSAAYRSRLDLQLDDRWAVLWSAGHLAGVGLLVAGLLVLTGLAGWGWGRRRARSGVRGARRAQALGAVGAALVVGGIAVVLTGGAGPVVSWSGSYPPLDCPDGAGCWSAVLVAPQLAGLGTAVAGALVLALVAGRLLGRDARTADGG